MFLIFFNTDSGVIEERITNKNFDGIFLDTIDWIDFYNNNPSISKNMLEGYEKFLKDIKELYPDLIIIQNRGFKSLKNFSYKYIDGIVWENFNYKKTFKEDKYITSNLIFQNQFKGIKVFTISHTDYNENKKLSNKLNWIYMKNKNSYSIWPD